MGTVSFIAFALLILTFLFLTGLHQHAAATDVATREALEIVIGIGGGGGSNSPSPPPPEQSLCPPPPLPTRSPFPSKRIELVYPVIQKFKTRIKNDPKGIMRTWVGPNVCNYKGFYCDVVPSYKVQALAGVDFNGFNFAGPDLSLAGFIEELPDIAIFHANSNSFTGTIPKKVAGLRYLYELDLSNNHLSGSFPMEVLGATNLSFLDLRFNSLAGVVPLQVFMLDLDVLFINDNNFVQKLPENLGSTSVLYLTLANNKFTGSIPRSIGRASETLVEMLFLNNQLSGCLPYEIGLLKKATVFDVSRNHLTGPIPQSFCCLYKLQILNLAQNEFYGPVPEKICKLPNLVKVSLSYNYFTEVGPECRKLITRNVLDVKMNCVSGLPMQRSAADCAAFFRWHRRCPDERSLSLIPCGSHAEANSREKSDGRSTAASDAPAPMISYGALTPH